MEALTPLVLHWLAWLWMKAMLLRLLRFHVAALGADPVVTTLSLLAGSLLGLWLAWRDW